MRIGTLAVVVAGSLLIGQAFAQTGTTSPGAATPSPGSSPSTVTAPRPAPGTEGSSGSTSGGSSGVSSTSPGASTDTRQPTAREVELRRKSDIIDRKVRRGICVGC